MKLFLSILLVLFIPIFGISNNSSKDSITVNTETVIDRLGIDTGKSEEELEELKQEYAKKFKNLFPPNFKSTAHKSYFEKKINLNEIKKFENNGLNLREFSVAEGASYQKNTLYSDVIVTGKAVELITKGEDFTPRYKLEIEKIISGSEIIESIYGEIPECIYYVAFLGTSYDRESILNRKGIYFLRVQPYTKENTLFSKRPFSTVMVYNDSIVCYERNIGMFNQAFINIHERSHTKKMQNEFEKKKWHQRYENGYIKESWDEIIANIYKILEINDSENFYEKTWK
jgi:hypothetical protein